MALFPGKAQIVYLEKNPSPHKHTVRSFHSVKGTSRSDVTSNFLGLILL